MKLPTPFSLSLCAIYCVLHAHLVVLVAALWPVPRNLETGTGFLKLAPGFDIRVDIPSTLKSAAGSQGTVTENGVDARVPEDLLNAIERTKTRLWGDKLQRLVPHRGHKDREALSSAPELSLLAISFTGANNDDGVNGQITLNSIAVEATKDILSRDESYSLYVPEDGQDGPARIVANTTLGVLRGLTTFEQLFYYLPNEGGGEGEGKEGVVYAHEVPVVVKDDRPAFPYRGFMLDTARNFFPIPEIKRTLDTMSLVKMSVFHWHIVDSQSFPLEVPGFEELSERGAYSEGEKYSVEDVRGIVRCAAERGIDVLLEVDIPGHTAVIANAYPEHIACPYASPWAKYANEPPAGQLRLASPSTLDFTKSLIGSITKSVLPERGHAGPSSSMFGTGGDEVNMNCYMEDDQTQRELKETGMSVEQALGEFVGGVHEVVREGGRRVVVWEEMALEHDGVKLDNDTVVMVWISAKNAKAVAKKGLHVVHAPSDHFYLDCGGGEWIGDSAGTNSWCDPFKSWQKAYTFDPLAKLSAKEAALILGGQQLLWAEQASPQNLDPIVWPRAAVSAEIFWTGPRLPSGAFRSVKEALPRMHDVRFRMVQRGVGAVPLQPLWCALRSGEGECDSGGVNRMVYRLSVRWVMKKVRRWVERVWGLWEAMYRERIGFTEL